MPDDSILPPRWQQALTTWKAYAGIAAFVLAVATFIADYSKKLPSVFQWWRDLPLPAKIVFGILAVIVSALLLISAWSRRSVLVRREKFDVQPDNPEQLIGRDNDIRRISDVCIAFPLVFLLGESGAGKSALVEAGLMPHLLDENARTAGRLVPVRVDASALDWERGLRVEVARSVRALPTESLKLLGVTDFQNLPNADQVFAWLERLPEVAPCRLLIILDQMDDYFVAHQRRFISAEDCIAQPDDLFAASEDWKDLAQLTRLQRISLLLVCRTDSAAPLSALRFQEPREPVLRRIAEQDARELLERITAPENGKPVIADPTFGWEKLRDRFLADVSDKEGQVLPSDLAAGLRNLRDLRYLDVAAYAAAGGLDGLENDRIQTIVREASAKAKLSSDALFRGLLALTSDDGRKTVVRSIEEFATIVLQGPPESEAIDASGQRLALIEPALSYLEEERILRRLLPESGHESLALFHDRLARSIRRAEIQANKWVHLLQDGNRKWRLAGNWRERWRSFLSIGVQTRLLWERLRGRMRYAENVRFVAYSLLRVVPYLFLCAILAYGILSWKGNLDYRSAEAIEREITNRSGTRSDEGKAFETLACSNASVRLNCVKVLLSSNVGAEKVQNKQALIVHAIVGLDPEAKTTNAVIRRVIGRIIRDPHSSFRKLDTALTLIGILPARGSDFKVLTSLIVERMKSEKDPDSLSKLGEALGSLSSKLEPKDAATYAAVLVERMKSEKDPDSLSGLGEALDNLSSKLEPKDAATYAAVLVERMKSEKEVRSLAGLGEALGNLSSKLEPKDAATYAAVLVERMKSEKDPDSLSDLSKALGNLSSKLEPKDAATYAAVLVERMKSEKEVRSLAGLGKALGNLSSKLEPKDVEPAAALLIERMKSEKDPDSLSDLSEALGSLSSKLEPKDAATYAAVLVERMKSENQFFLPDLGEALGRLSSKLQPKDVEPAAAVLIERMKSEKEQFYLPYLSKALGRLSSKLEPKDVESAAALLIERMKSENQIFLRYLSEALGNLSSKLEPKDAATYAAVLIERMKSENQFFLPDLSKALGRLSSKLEPKDAATYAAVLIERMKSEKHPDSLSGLGEALGNLSSKLEPKDAATYAAVLVERMKSEKEVSSLAGLGKALGNLSSKLEPKDVEPAAALLIERMKSEKDPDSLSDLSEALGSLSSKLEPKDAATYAAVLVERMKSEADSEVLEGLLVVWTQLEPIAYRTWSLPQRIQNCIDLLQHPLAGGKSQESILACAKVITGHDFHNNPREFVDWATSVEGKKLGLSVKPRPYVWSTLNGR